jgi:hypothetical protein
MSRFVDSIFEMPAPFNMVVVIVLIAVVAGLISTIVRETRKYFCHRNEIELKREMLERGMEPQEIEQVMRATSAKSNERR